MSKLIWVLKLKRTQTFNGDKLETLESYEFDNLEDASEAEFRIHNVGVWDRTFDNGAGVSYSSKGLECLELVSLEEKG